MEQDKEIKKETFEQENQNKETQKDTSEKEGACKTLRNLH
jgi:hypothetical protein